MKLIKDLGKCDTGKIKRHFGLFKCPDCKKEFKRRIEIASPRCFACSNVLKGRANSKKSKDNFIKLCSNIHNNKYDYSLVNYTGNKNKVKIICPHHGVFEQSPNHHKNKRGCPSCANKHADKTFKVDSNKIHKNMYDYSLVNYINSHTKVKIICPYHGEFLQTPNSHKSGSGCPICFCGGFDKNKSGILYYLKIIHDKQIYYKIGITNRSINERFNAKDLKKIKVIKIWNYNLGVDAFLKEQQILNLYKEHQYTGGKILTSGGNTEIFIFDILNLDIN
jgi:ribosomal protein L37AE/L43A